MEQCITKMDNKVKQNSMVPEAFVKCFKQSDSISGAFDLVYLALMGPSRCRLNVLRPRNTAFARNGLVDRIHMVF